MILRRLWKIFEQALLMKNGSFEKFNAYRDEKNLLRVKPRITEAFIQTIIRSTRCCYTMNCYLQVYRRGV